MRWTKCCARTRAARRDRLKRRRLGQSSTAVYALAFSPSRSNILDTMRGNNKNEMNPSPDLLAATPEPGAAAGKITRRNFDGLITLDASGLPTICGLPIANLQGVLLASQVKAGLRGW